uniref:Uncharacterized protein n=1 Tax=Pristionchus pacificus TaxID=54126 RepID=A0A2A6D1L2_PRIPA|eukprot:PDM84372.1 hypothetical protein PRIPAC_33395 [Pristionchus pacificus]
MKLAHYLLLLSIGGLFSAVPAATVARNPRNLRTQEEAKMRLLPKKEARSLKRREEKQQKELSSARFSSLKRVLGKKTPEQRGMKMVEKMCGKDSDKRKESGAQN